MIPLLICLTVLAIGLLALVLEVIFSIYAVKRDVRGLREREAQRQQEETTP